MPVEQAYAQDLLGMEIMLESLKGKTAEECLKTVQELLYGTEMTKSEATRSYAKITCYASSDDPMQRTEFFLKSALIAQKYHHEEDYQRFITEAWVAFEEALKLLMPVVR